MLKCDFNKVAKQLYWNRTSAWVFSCKFAAYFQNTFSQEHLWVAAFEWNVFKSKGLHLIHLKIDELWYIANSSNVAVIGISKSKLDESILQSEIQINNYDLLRRDRNRNGGGVACYIRSDISYIQKQYFPEEIKNIFFEILLPKTKPIVVGIIYSTTSQNNFPEILNKNFPSIDTDLKETYILGDFNINIYENNK